MPIPRLVTPERAKEHLLVDHNYDDSKIIFMVEQASAIVLNYIKQYPRTTYQTLPLVADDLIMAEPWPLTYWGPYGPYRNWSWYVPRISYQNLPPYVADTWVDDEGEPNNVPGAVSVSTLMVIGNLYKDREGADDPISKGVRSLLIRYRDPALA
jgi:hypothetical protein